MHTGMPIGRDAVIRLISVALTLAACTNPVSQRKIAAGTVNTAAPMPPGATPSPPIPSGPISQAGTGPAPALALPAANPIVIPGTGAAPVLPVTTGQLWSDPATWGGAVPGPTSPAVIPTGKTVILDQDAEVGHVTVNGVLAFRADRDLHLTASSIRVLDGGILQVGAPTAPYRNRATITLKSSNVTEDLDGFGTQMIGVADGGRLEIHGEQQVSWTRLAATVAAGATDITTIGPVDRRAGERIVLASSSFNPDEIDVRTVVSVAANGRITLDKPLSFAHFGELQTFDGRTLDARAEVGLLSRNIVIEGDAQSSALACGPWASRPLRTHRAIT